MKKYLVELCFIFSLVSIYECYDPAAEQANRLKIFRKTCQKYNDDLTYEHSVLYGTSFEPGNYIASPLNKFVICIPAKTGAQSFGVMMKVLNFWNDFNLTPEEREKNPKFENADMHHYHKAIVVRHPLERILSLYRYTLSDTVIMSEVNNRGLEFWLQRRKDKLNPEPGEKVYNNVQNILTFRQYVNFLTKCTAETPDCAHWASEGAAYHWAPVWAYCNNLCYHDFDSIIHLNSGQADKEYVFNLVGANNSIPLDHINKSAEKHSSENKVAREYYGRLLKSEIYELYQKYRLDHELFGFSPDEYIAMGQDEIKY